MRKRWIWMGLIATLAVVIWRWQTVLPIPFALPVRQPPDQFAALAIESLPVVKSERLLTDLEALTFDRYEPADRQKARDYILQALAAAGWKTQQQPFAGGINLYAERPGTDPTAGTILLGAHYDTVAGSPGADDNASSVATVLEAARLLGQQTTPRGLQVVFFDLEEQGLLGSQAFLEQVVQPEKLQAAVVLDMVGYACEQAGCQSYPPVLPSRPQTDRGNFLAVLGDQPHSQLLQRFTQPAQKQVPPVLTLAIPTLGGLAPDLVRSDHAPFWKAGIGAVLVTDTANFRNPNYHQPSDTLDTINPEFFVGSAQIVTNAVTYLLQP